MVGWGSGFQDPRSRKNLSRIQEESKRHMLIKQHGTTVRLIDLTSLTVLQKVHFSILPNFAEFFVILRYL
jgi:hypothetical protein